MEDPEAQRKRSVSEDVAGETEEMLYPGWWRPRAGGGRCRRGHGCAGIRRVPSPVSGLE